MQCLAYPYWHLQREWRSAQRRPASQLGDAAFSNDDGYSLIESKEDYMNKSDYSYVFLVCLGVVATFNFESSE